MQVKTLDLSAKEFMANGKKYIVMDKICIDRYAEYQKLVPLLTYGTSFEEMNKQHKLLYQYLNKQNFADAAVICHNLMIGVAAAEDATRVSPALKMAALFINRQDENVDTFDEQILLDKCEDWRKEGYDMSCFFSLALNSIKGFSAAYLEFTEKKNQIEI